MSLSILKTFNMPQSNCNTPFILLVKLQPISIYDDMRYTVLVARLTDRGSQAAGGDRWIQKHGLHCGRCSDRDVREACMSTSRRLVRLSWSLSGGWDTWFSRQGWLRWGVFREKQRVHPSAGIPCTKSQEPGMFVKLSSSAYPKSKSLG
jgi:hypothetical protein